MAMEKMAERGTPKGLARLFVRAPIWLYRWGLGSLLGGRFLLLEHRGRKSGLTRQAVLEVVHHDPDRGTYVVASGLGKRSDWYRNVLVTPRVTLGVGSRRLKAVAEPLSPEASGEAMVTYAREHPVAARKIAKGCGFRVDGSEEDYFALGHDGIPMVLFRTEEAA